MLVRGLDLRPVQDLSAAAVGGVQDEGAAGNRAIKTLAPAPQPVREAPAEERPRRPLVLSETPSIGAATFPNGEVQIQ